MAACPQTNQQTNLKYLLKSDEITAHLTPMDVTVLAA
jgi:hypothetical protein